MLLEIKRYICRKFLEMPIDNPEERARRTIDKQLLEAGWKPIDRNQYETGLQAVAVREMSSGNNKRADYILFLKGIAVGVIEAKRDDIELLTTSHITQVLYYARHPKKWYKSFSGILPLAWLANGKETLFRNLKDADGEFEDVNGFLRPKDVRRILDISDEWAGLPALDKDGLRNCQYEAVSRLEQSFNNGKRRALIVLATGAGKTFAACLTCYRWLNYTSSFKRILFLVDRNNLAQQAFDDFSTFRLTASGKPFTSIFVVSRIRNKKIPDDASVVIGTIQGLYALLKGETVNEDDNDDNNWADEGEEHSVEGRARLPHDYFDLIIIDECHRSIYKSWRKVLEYFSEARMIGLTATPTPEAEAFFDRNTIIDYTYDQSVNDHVNVEYQPFLIRTKVSELGGTIAAEEKVRIIKNINNASDIITNHDEKFYSPEELNRSVVNPAQIRLILETYRDSVYRDLFCADNGNPRSDDDYLSLPKTLIFALNERHATLIENIAREVFVKSKEEYPHFVQKITYHSDDSNILIKNFRNNVDFRIAITVTLVATGTDVRPIEVLLFMRYVESVTLYKQMLGRGIRTIADDALRSVTPNAVSKTICYVVDAVGVTQNVHTLPKLNLEPGIHNPTLEELLNHIAYGEVDDLNLSLLASRMNRIDSKADEKEKEKFKTLAGETMRQVYTAITEAFGHGLPPYVNVKEPNAERTALVHSLQEHSDARSYLIELAAGKTTILIHGTDEILFQGFSPRDAYQLTYSFEQFVMQHSDEIEALRIIFNRQDLPLTRKMLLDLQDKLANANRKFVIPHLWNTYHFEQRNNVRQLTTKNEREALTNLIQLVRFAYGQTKTLAPISSYANSLFNLWCGKRHDELTNTQQKLFSRIKDYVVTNGSTDIAAISKYDSTLSVKLVLSYRLTTATDAEARLKANEEVMSLSQFLINNNYEAAI